MKRIILSIALLFAVVATNAQTIDWGTFVESSGNPYSISSNNTSFTYTSNLLQADFSLDPNGHTIHYNITAKNIPANVGNMMAEYQANLSFDGWPTHHYAIKQSVWNVPLSYGYGSDYDHEAYPTSSEYSYAGSFDLDVSEDLPLFFSAGIMYWNDNDYFDYAGFQLFPHITP